MYGHKYEYELLLSLRLMKCLHQENPAALNNALKGEDQFNEDTIPAMAEYIFWEICQNVIGNFEFMNEEDELYGDECRIETVEFTLPDISRFGVLNCKWNSLKGYPIGAWQEKFSNALGYFLGKCDSICNLECFTQGHPPDSKYGSLRTAAIIWSLAMPS